MTGITRGRALGLKLILLGGIVILLGIPLFLVGILSWERSSREAEAIGEVSRSVGGPQTLRGPFLVIPYSFQTTIHETRDGRQLSRTGLETRHLLVSPDTIEIALDQTVEMRHRGIYDIPVYTLDIRASGAFVVPELASQIPDRAELDWSAAGIVVIVNDLRAISRRVDLTIPGRGRLDFEPGSPIDGDGWRGISAPLGSIAPGQRLAFDLETGLTGASSLKVTAIGRDTQVSLVSNWQHPAFTGGFLPDTSEIGPDGFRASWTVPYLARGVPAVWQPRSGDAATLEEQAFGVSLVSPAGGYQRVGRALKYGLFFVGLLMLCVFLIEARTGQRIHPVQYTLMGIAQVVFYLLLLALSEHVNVVPAFALATLATVGLSGFYAMNAFSSRPLGTATGAAMGVVYITQFLLLMVEDYALLVGAVMAFLALASAMVLTRQVEWYAVTQDGRPG